MCECRHCECEINPSKKCSKCGVNLVKEKRCLTCHLEVVHGVITNQNISICGGGPSCKTNRPEDDVDAFSPCWRQGN